MIPPSGPVCQQAIEAQNEETKQQRQQEEARKRKREEGQEWRASRELKNLQERQVRETKPPIGDTFTFDVFIFRIGRYANVAVTSHAAQSCRTCVLNNLMCLPFRHPKTCSQATVMDTPR